MKLKDIDNEKLEKILTKAFTPRVHCAYRFGMDREPRQVSLEFCGWQAAFLFDQNSEIDSDTVYAMLFTAFQNSRKRPGFFKRQYLKIRQKISDRKYRTE